MKKIPFNKPMLLMLGFYLLASTQLVTAADVASKFALKSSDQATIQNDVKSRFEGLPKNGYAVLTGIRNSTGWSAGLEFEKTIHDELPLETVIAIKHRATGKYLAARKVVVAGKEAWYIKPDAATSAEKESQFVIDRHISSVPKLKDWLGLQSVVANECMLKVTPDGLLQFEGHDFMDDVNDKECHWEIIGSQLAGCYLRNRDDKGFATFQQGVKEVWVRDDNEVTVEKATMATAIDDPELAPVRYGDVITLKMSDDSFVGAYGIYGYAKGLETYGGSDKNNTLALLRIRPGALTPTVKGYIQFMICGANGEINGAPIQSGARVTLRNLGASGTPIPQESFRTRRYALANGLVRSPGKEWGLGVSKNRQNITNLFRFDLTNQDGSGGTLQYGKRVTISNPERKTFWWSGNVGTWKNEAGFSTGPLLANNSKSPKNDDNGFMICTDEGTPTLVRNTAVTVASGIQDWKANSGQFADLAVRNLSDAWGVTVDGDVFHWDGKDWTPIPANIKFRSIAVSAAGDVFAIGDGEEGGKLYARSDISPTNTIGRSWTPQNLGDSAIPPRSASPTTNAYREVQLRRYLPGGLAAISKTAAWFIGKNGALYKFADGSCAKQSTLTPDKTSADSPATTAIPTPGANKTVAAAPPATTDMAAQVTAVSCADDGSTWAVTDWKKVWHLVPDPKDASLKQWQMVDVPLEKPFITSIAVRSDTEVYITGFDGGQLFAWDGSAWTKTATKNLKRIAVGSGINNKITKITQRLNIAQMMTKAIADGSVLETSPDAMLDIEVLELGMKGNIKPNATIDLELPAQQNPSVTGFAQTKIDLGSGAELSLRPLKGKGAAWPDKTFDTPNSATIAFMGMPEDKGDIQVTLGNAISDTFLFKIVIGGQKNTRSSIIQRTLEDGDYVDREVFGIDVEENNLAYAAPGIYTPYWVTYDKGLILVGMGQVGENVFMAYRAEKPPKLVNRAGFSCKDSSVKYSDIQFLFPVVTQDFKRAFVTRATVQNVPANPSNIVWSDLPFRFGGEGTVSFDIQADEEFALALGTKASTQEPHYVIVFNEEDDEAISIKRWSTEKRAYKEIARMPNKGYKGLNLAPNVWTPVWVSYNDGLFIIGNGAPGKNTVFVYKDLGYPDGISRVGFGSFGTSPAKIRNVSIAPATNLVSQIPMADVENMSSKLAAFAGPVQIILPFDYKIYQTGPSLKVDDRITSQSFFIAGMPQQGALYYYLATIQDDGFLKMAPSRDPENPIQTNINRDIVATSAASDLARAKAEVLAKQSDAIKALAVAAGDKDRAASQALLQTANMAITAGTGIASAGGFCQVPGVAPAALILGGSIAASGIAISAVAGKRAGDAAAKDLAGAEAAAVAQRQMLNTQMQAEEMNFRAKLLSGNAQFAFKSSKAYVFVDTPARPALGESNVPKEAVENKQQVMDLLNITSTVPLDDPSGFEKLLAMLQDSVYLMNHYFVVTEFVKKKFIDKMNNLFDAYAPLYGSEPNVRVMNNMINLIFTAINNGYLVNAQVDSKTREVWYTWVNKLAHIMLLQTKSIRLNACYGEYIWLPFDVAVADDLTLTFEAEGLHDVLVAFAQEPKRMRNTNTEMYELCIGGWDNTKTAIRLTSLGNSVATFDKATNPDAMLNAYKRQQYTVSLKNGVISLAAGGKPVLSWQDPYPLKGVKWIGISTWDVPISFSKITVSSGGITSTDKKTAAKKPAANKPAANKPAANRPQTMAPVKQQDPLGDQAAVATDEQPEEEIDLTDEEIAEMLAEIEAEEAAQAAPVAPAPVVAQKRPPVAQVQQQQSARVQQAPARSQVQAPAPVQQKQPPAPRPQAAPAKPTVSTKPMRVVAPPPPVIVQPEEEFYADDEQYSDDEQYADDAGYDEAAEAALGMELDDAAYADEEYADEEYADEEYVDEESMQYDDSEEVA